MTDLAPVLTGCHVCRSPQVEVINGWMRAGVADMEISRRLKESGNYISRITLGNHHRKHLTTQHERDRRAAVEALQSQAEKGDGKPKVKNRDLAALVRDIVVEKVDAGDITPTLSDGLRAQEMLDRRAEKGADRDLMLQLAQVLGGATPVAYIEGEYREVDPEALEDNEALLQLTAGD